MRPMHPLHDSLPMLTQRVLASILPPFRALFTAHGITEQQWRIARILWETQPLSQNEIARQSLIPKQSLVGIIDRMESMGLLERGQSLADRRKSEIRLTPKAMEIKARISSQVDAINDRIHRRLTPQQWKELRAMLNRIAETADAD